MNCPHCGSASRSDWGYECGSHSNLEYERSMRCRTKEVANLNEELSAAKQRIKRLEEFTSRFLDPEDLGYAVDKHVRDDAREALGRERVEAKP